VVLALFAFSQSELLLIERFDCQLKRWKFSVHIRAGRAAAEAYLQSVPVVADVALEEKHLGEFLHLMRQSGNADSEPPVVGKLLASKACRSAIKFGDILAEAQVQTLLKELAATSMPFQCAHGRPSIVPLLAFREDNAKWRALNELPNVDKDKIKRFVRASRRAASAASVPSCVSDSPRPRTDPYDDAYSVLPDALLLLIQLPSESQHQA